MSRVLAAFEEHCAHVYLPRKLAKLSTEAGFEILERDVYVMLNPDFEPNTFSAGLIMGVATFVPGRREVTQEEATAWATEQLETGKTGQYFFCLNQYILTIRKPV